MAEINALKGLKVRLFYLILSFKAHFWPVDITQSDLIDITMGIGNQQFASKANGHNYNLSYTKQM